VPPNGRVGAVPFIVSDARFPQEIPGAVTFHISTSEITLMVQNFKWNIVAGT